MHFFNSKKNKLFTGTIGKVTIIAIVLIVFFLIAFFWIVAKSEAMFH